MTLVPVYIYRVKGSGRELVQADFLDDRECHACGGTRRWKASGKPIPVTVACPFCWRRQP
jgi:hypothetical protein